MERAYPTERFVYDPRNNNIEVSQSEAAIGQDNDSSTGLLAGLIDRAEKCGGKYPQFLSYYLKAQEKTYSKEGNICWLQSLVDDERVKVIHVFYPDKVNDINENGVSSFRGRDWRTFQSTGTAFELCYLFQAKKGRKYVFAWDYSGKLVRV